MRSPRKLLFLCLPFLFLGSPCLFAVGAGAVAQAKQCDYAAYRLSTWNRNREAIVYYTAAIKANPADFVAYYNRAGCYLESREWANALQDCNAAAKLNPTDAGTYYLRAVALEHLGRGAESKADLDQSERFKPSPAVSEYIAELRADLCADSAQPSPDEVRKSLRTLDRAVARSGNAKEKAQALNKRSWFRAVCRATSLGDGTQAVADATEACRLTHGRDMSYLDTLAAAYAAKGDFGRAIATEKKAIAMAWHERKTQAEFRRHWAAFELHQPYRLTMADRG